MATISDRRVLVTGASGFIGSHLTRRLVDLGADVHAVSSAREDPARLHDLVGRITTHTADITEDDAIGDVVDRARPDVVFHLAAATHVGRSWQHPASYVRTNITGTVRLLQAAERCDRFVYASSGDVYGALGVPFREDASVDPASPYAVSKHAAERYCRLLHDRAVIARPFNAYGPGQSPDRIVPETIVRALRGEALEMTSGTQTREFNHVGDLAEGFVLLATTDGVEGEVFNLGGGEEIAIRDVVTTILDLMGNPIEAKIGALPDRPGELMRMFCDSSKARRRLGWEPQRTLAEGLVETIAAYRTELER